MDSVNLKVYCIKYTRFLTFDKFTFFATAKIKIRTKNC
jgi:hypothetical protein